MNINLFDEKALKTCADSSDAYKRLKNNPVLMARLLRSMRTISKEADNLEEIKKEVFYGKERKINKLTWLYYKLLSFVYPSVERYSIPDVHFLHGILGIVGEGASEMFPLFLNKGFKKTDISVDSVIEEVGDIYWYLAPVKDAFGIEPSVPLKTVLSKLQARYGKTFDKTRAVNRNIEKEQKIIQESARKARTTKPKTKKP